MLVNKGQTLGKGHQGDNCTAQSPSNYRDGPISPRKQVLKNPEKLYFKTTKTTNQPTKIKGKHQVAFKAKL